MLPKLQAVADWFSCSPPHLNSSQLLPPPGSTALKATKLIFQILFALALTTNQNATVLISKLYYNHSNFLIFTFIFLLFLSEGRAADTWESSKKWCFFFPIESACNFSLAFLFSSTLLLLFFAFSLQRFINPLQTKRRPLYLKTQSVPRSKHFSSRL